VDKLEKQPLGSVRRKRKYDIKNMDVFRAIALMMKAARTSETSVNYYQTTCLNNPEDSHLHTRRRENQNLKRH
jgi:hypothetical protein